MRATPLGMLRRAPPVEIRHHAAAEPEKLYDQSLREVIVDFTGFVMALIWLAYTSRQFSMDRPLSKLTVYANGLNVLWRLNFVTRPNYAAAATTLGLVMSATFCIVGLAQGGWDVIYGDRPWDPLDSFVDHILLPVEAFAVALYQGYYTTDAFASTAYVTMMTLLYLPLYMIDQPYPGLRGNASTLLSSIGVPLLHLLIVRTSQICARGRVSV